MACGGLALVIFESAKLPEFGIVLANVSLEMEVVWERQGVQFPSLLKDNMIHLEIKC